MKKALKIFGGVLLLFVFVWTIYFLYKKSEKKPEVFETESPVVTDIIKKTVATGSIVPRKEILIKPKVSGIIEKIYVEAGHMIKEGDVIARVKIIPDMINLNNAESRVNRSRINLENAQKDYDRNKSLFDNGVISKSDMQRLEVALKSAREETDAADNNLQLIRAGATAKSGSASNTLIRSTISGMILDMPVKEGNSVIESNTFNEGTTIAVVADMGEMIFEGKVDESEVGKIKPGMDIILTIGAIESMKFKAKLEYISPKGVEENGAIQFQIKAALQLEDSVFVRAGYSANADIVLDRRDQVLAVKEGLLQFDKDSAYVEIATGEQQFEKRFVKLGLSDGINVEVLNGIDKNAKIKQWNVLAKKDEGEGKS